MNTWNDFRVKENTKTWTELYFEMAEFAYNNKPYVSTVPYNVEHLMKDSLKHLGRSKIKFGLNIGGSLSTKIWPLDAWEKFAKSLISLNYWVVFIGGTSDEHNYKTLEQRFAEYHKEQVFFPGYNNSIENTCALIKHLDVIVSGDTFAFHIALAFDIFGVILFGPSNPSEVIPKHKTNTKDIRGHTKCSPCADQVQCHGNGGCMDFIPADAVLASVKECVKQMG